MAEKVPMIALSPTMEKGTVARWRRKVGDVIKSGDVLCEVETDKATMDYEASVEGTLLAIVVPEGGQAGVGETIAIVGAPGAAGVPGVGVAGAGGAATGAAAAGGAAFTAAGAAAGALTTSPGAPTMAMVSPTAACPPSGTTIASSVPSTDDS